MCVSMVPVVAAAASSVEAVVLVAVEVSAATDADESVLCFDAASVLVDDDDLSVTATEPLALVLALNEPEVVVEEELGDSVEVLLLC